MSTSLFEKYGGFDTFSTVVSNFYKKILDSDRLAHYFDKIDMDKLMSHQTNFISHALGGPNRYQGRQVALAHAQLGISNDEFSEVLELLEETLEESEVEADDIQTIIEVVDALRPEIVTA